MRAMTEASVMRMKSLVIPKDKKREKSDQAMAWSRRVQVKDEEAKRISRRMGLTLFSICSTTSFSRSMAGVASIAVKLLFKGNLVSVVDWDYKIAPFKVA